MQYQGHLQQAFVVVGLEVERLTVAINRARLAAGLAHQAQQIIGLRRRPAFTQVGFADVRRFLEPTRLGQAARGFQVTAEGGRWLGRDGER